VIYLPAFAASFTGRAFLPIYSAIAYSTIAYSTTAYSITVYLALAVRRRGYSFTVFSVG